MTVATTVLFRINGKEVIKISTKGQTFVDRNTTYWGVLTDPPFSDGTVIRDSNEDLRVLGFAKMWDGTNVRNATQTEIDNFVVAEEEDDKLQDKDAAINLFKANPRFRKMMIAFADIIKNEINILRRKHGLADRELPQLYTAIENRINKDD